MQDHRNVDQIKKLLGMRRRGTSRSLERFVPCIPPRSTHQSANTILRSKAGRYFVGKTGKGKQVANEMYLRMLTAKPAVPFAGELTLGITILFPFNKTEKKSIVEQQLVAHTKRPDLDNLTKGIMDAMQQANYFKDDAQVAHLYVNKYYSSITGYYIQMIEHS